MEYKGLIVMTPNGPCAHFGLSDAYRLKGDLDLALMEIEEAMRLKPDWPYYHNKMGKILNLQATGGRRWPSSRSPCALSPTMRMRWLT